MRRSAAHVHELGFRFATSNGGDSESGVFRLDTRSQQHAVHSAGAVTHAELGASTQVPGSLPYLISRDRPWLTPSSIDLGVGVGHFPDAFPLDALEQSISDASSTEPDPW